MVDGTCVLQARSLTVRYYGRIGGIEDLSLTVDRGETIALVGTNGSGKTSALRALAGFLAQDTGRIMVAMSFSTDETSPAVARSRLRRSGSR